MEKLESAKIAEVDISSLENDNKTLLTRIAALEALVVVKDEALTLVRSIIAEGALEGFNPLAGTWADRLFKSQYNTSEALTSTPVNTGKELKELREKLAYVHSMGLRFGMMKTTDKPAPYLAHVWDEESDHERMFREWFDSIGWETAVAKLKEDLRIEKDISSWNYNLAKATAEITAKGQNNEMRSILMHIHSARIAMNQEAVVKGLEAVDAFFREPNHN